jgi:hypothetical protein
VGKKSPSVELNGREKLAAKGGDIDKEVET